MLLKKYRKPAFILRAIDLYVHAIGIAIPLGYSIYHILHETLTIGVLSLALAAIGAHTFVCKLRNKTHTPCYFIYCLLLGIILTITSYLHGYSGLIFLFPYAASLFFLLPFKIAIIKGVIFSLLCFIAASPFMDIESIVRFASAFMISIGVLTYYAYMTLQEKSVLKKAAHNDALTGIRNRRYFEKWLQDLAKHAPEKYQEITIFYIDIDNFKDINDSFGHKAGDDLLKRFTRRIINIIRNDDLIRNNANIDNFARLSGDEFILAIKYLPNATTAQSIAARIIKKISRPFQLNNNKHYISISIGIAFARDGIATNTLLNNADTAMYQAKRLGKNTFHFFNNHSSDKNERKKDIEETIIRGLTENHFYLAFMPIFHVEANKAPHIIGYETLLRCHKEHISPEKLQEIIPIAEDSEIIKKLDLWVIETTFKHLSLLSENQRNQQWFAINISSAELSDHQFISRITELVKLYHIDPNNIHLEITETKLAPFNPLTIDQMLTLKHLGFKLALDDYGTGFTGLSQLLNFPGDHIKIDRSFTSAIGQKANKAEKMIALMLSIAKVCELDVIVEGVETEEQLRHLINLGCQSAQGYYLSKPIAWENVIINT